MKTTFRKITALLMALMLLLACFGCSSDSDKGNEKEKAEDINTSTSLKFVRCDNLAASTFHTLGLKADGTVIATGSNDDDRCNVSDWADIRIPE